LSTAEFQRHLVELDRSTHSPVQPLEGLAFAFEPLTGASTPER